MATCLAIAREARDDGDRSTGSSMMSAQTGKYNDVRITRKLEQSELVRLLHTNN